MTKSTKSGAATMLAAKRFSRRTMLKAGAAAGALAVAGPALVRNARSSSGELNLLMWSDEFPNPVIPNFESKTGIKVNSDAVLAERGADQQAAGDRRRGLRSLPADPRPRSAVQGPGRRLRPST